MAADQETTRTQSSTGMKDADMLGRTISHYQIDSLVGQGGMGVVYKATDLRLHRFVALKFLHERLTNSRGQLAALEREAFALSALNHPNIATIHGIEEAEGFKFLVFEYLPGGTLKDKIENARVNGAAIPLGQALDYAIQLADGLAHAHQHGIIHRDIKSSNVLFTAEGGLKLADFSLASSDYHSDPADASSIAGTPSSMSPEQALGKNLDHRSDIFSVGIVLFELFTGTMPFRAHGHAEVLRKIVGEPAPLLSQFRPGLPAALETIIRTALQKDRERRYQKIDTLASDLRSVRHKLDAISRDATAQETATITATGARRRGVRALGIVSLLLGSSLAMYELPSIGRSVLATLHIHPLPLEKRLVVLSFSGSGSTRELCDGLMDVISSKLTEMEQFQGALLVISPSEVRKAEVHTPSEAREAFGATLAITGTMRPQGNGVRVMVNLVDTETLAQLRSFTIGIDNADTFEDGLVSKAGEMLEISLAPRALLALGLGNTRSASAYRNYVEGRGYLQRVDNAEYLDKAITQFQKAIDVDPRYALAYAGLADAWLERGNSSKEPSSLDEALKNASRAVELNGGSAEIHVTIGRVFSAKGQYEEAERQFEEALKIDPVNAEALRRLARNYERLNRRKEAEATCRRAIKLRPNDWRGYQFLGNFYFNGGNVQEAISNYQRVLSLTPGNHNAYNDLGAAYLRLGEYSQAEAYLQKSAKLRSTPLNCSNLGSLYYFQRRYREAVPWYEKAVAAAGTNTTWWGNLADAYRETPELASKAPDAYRKAIACGLRELSANPRNARLRARIADCYAAAGDTASASREILQALRLSPDDGLVQFRAALVYEQSHNRNAALEALAAALRAGYPLEEIRNAPVFRDLAEDSRYKSLEQIDQNKGAAK
jgi:serine/threonine-protein kinase